jgi:Zn ribbon nucleic-acid-binding protein
LQQKDKNKTGGMNMEEKINITINSSLGGKCPECEKGNMLPFSMNHDKYEYWECSNCGYRKDKNIRKK